MPSMPSMPSMPAVPNDERSTQFVQGFDEMTGSGRSETLGRLAEDPNAGPWRERARSLLEGKERAGNLSRENENLRQQLRQARATEEQMARDNASLKKDLEQLKRILVDMETRPK
jgi:hypothetical protein